MPQFAKQSSRPLSPESYRAAARKLRRIADDLEARCTPQTPREQASLTRTIHVLLQMARHLRDRHQRKLDERQNHN